MRLPLFKIVSVAIAILESLAGFLKPSKGDKIS